MASILPLLQQYFTVALTPPFPAGSIPIEVDDQIVAVLDTDLTKRERALLHALVPAATSSHPWARFLRGETSAPSSKPVRFVQFFSDFAQANASPQEWLEAFISLFTDDVTGFFENPNHGVIVEPLSKLPADENALLGMMDTLDSDFGTKTRVYIGHFWPADSKLPALFAEEAKLFSSSRTRVTKLQDAALAYYTQDARKTSPVLQGLQHLISKDELDMRPVITALFHNQGNLTAAAKALYLHRNTLQYRIDKFQAQTGFSLKQMDDLVLCYLLIQ